MNSLFLVMVLMLLVNRHQALRVIGGLRGGRGLFFNQHHKSRALFTSAAAEPVAALPVCSEEIVVLKNPSCNREVVLIGTAHISEKSAALVRTTIQTWRPDVVMVELDASRLYKVWKKGQQADIIQFIHRNVTDEGIVRMPTSLRPLRSLPSRAMNGIKKHAHDLLITVTAKSMQYFFIFVYWTLKRQGFTVGGEFRAAIEEAQKIQAKVLLGDNNVSKTMRLVAAALWQVGFWNSWKALCADDEVDGMQKLDGLPLVAKVEAMKSNDLFIPLMQGLRSRHPALFDAFVTQRNEFMSQAIRQTDCRRMVAVVGFGHLSGITACLTEKGGYELVTPAAVAAGDVGDKKATDS